MDFSRKAVHQMKKTYVHIKFSEVDLHNIMTRYPRWVFDLVVDKGASDCLIYKKKEE